MSKNVVVVTVAYYQFGIKKVGDNYNYIRWRAGS
ncbi:hypothetical protein MHFGQ_16770 [Moorella humiferrea]|jgi:hypothetical protein|uniref:Uncharacterized protein n=1 Tax=Neomoorella humiferrea TaxID=676965 RepID=A0A2T0AQZ7_9FIRM|nr:hypothetical protein MOHU_15390 [Moorella humiferrea]